MFLNRIVRQHVRGKLPPRAESLLVEIPPLIQRCQRNGVAVLPHILSKLVKLVPSHSGRRIVSRPGGEPLPDLLVQMRIDLPMLHCAFARLYETSLRA